MNEKVLYSEKSNQPIILLGYMGCGKSTVGRLLAKHLALPFVDLDDYLSEIHGHSVPNLFLQYGEIGFRKLEKTALDDLLVSDQASVLSLGGGTPCYADNMQSVIRSTPHTFYLSPSISTLCYRLFSKKDHRPMISHLTSADKLQEFIAKHIFERKLFYEQANHLMSIQDETPQELVDQIIKKLG
ncbi:MAG: shikimate kinase [Flavobacteriaceae bacterium]|nr:shikimate kinase [Flavobacteriaceae bacterium]